MVSNLIPTIIFHRKFTFKVKQNYKERYNKADIIFPKLNKTIKKDITKRISYFPLIKCASIFMSYFITYVQYIFYNILDLIVKD